MTALGENLPPRERIFAEGGWRVAHAFDSMLPGWLVLVPTRHVAALDELTVEEAKEFGLLARRASIALRDVVGCEKTFLMLFAEREGFAHLHVHVVPRMSDLDPQARGPRVFALVSADEAAWIPEPERDALALRLGEAMARCR